MKRFITLIFSLTISFIVLAQTNIVQPKIMVVPYIKDGENYKEVIENNVNNRIILTKIKEAFDNRGYTTVDFIGKLNSIKQINLMTEENQKDSKSIIISQSGADVYVTAEMSVDFSSSGNSVKTILTAYDVSTGNSLADKIGNSGKFYTDDIGKLGEKAVEKIADEFLDVIKRKFNDIIEDGRSIAINFQFDEYSELTMSTEVGDDSLPLSDVIELWISEHAYKNNYHIQGTSDLQMIFDDVHIPVKNKNGKNYTINFFALEIYKYMNSLGIKINKTIKNNAIIISFK